MKMLTMDDGDYHSISSSGAPGSGELKLTLNFGYSSRISDLDNIRQRNILKFSAF